MRIDNLVKAGEYTTKNEFIRFALKQMLSREERTARLEAAASKLQKQTKSRKQVEDEIEGAKAETRRALSKSQVARKQTSQLFYKAHRRERRNIRLVVKSAMM